MCKTLTLWWKRNQRVDETPRIISLTNIYINLWGNSLLLANSPYKKTFSLTKVTRLGTLPPFELFIVFFLPIKKTNREWGRRGPKFRDNFFFKVTTFECQISNLTPCNGYIRKVSFFSPKMMKSFWWCTASNNILWIFTQWHKFEPSAKGG